VYIADAGPHRTTTGHRTCRRLPDQEESRTGNLESSTTKTLWAPTNSPEKSPSSPAAAVAWALPLPRGSSPKEKGRLDILFANAGGGEFVPLEQVTKAHFDKVFWH